MAEERTTLDRGPIPVTKAMRTLARELKAKIVERRSLDGGSEDDIRVARAQLDEIELRGKLAETTEAAKQLAGDD